MHERIVKLNIIQFKVGIYIFATLGSHDKVNTYIRRMRKRMHHPILVFRTPSSGQQGDPNTNVSNDFTRTAAHRKRRNGSKSTTQRYWWKQSCSEQRNRFHFTLFLSLFLDHVQQPCSRLESLKGVGYWVSTWAERDMKQMHCWLFDGKCQTKEEIQDEAWIILPRLMRWTHATA